MAYEKLGFVDKETPLDAAHFNHMEGGIETANSVLETTTSNEITWDGVVGDRHAVQMDESITAVHITDAVPNISDLMQGYTISSKRLSDDGVNSELSYTAEEAALNTPEVIPGVIYGLAGSEAGFVVLEDYAFEGITFKKGTYLNIFGTAYFDRLTGPEITFSTTKIKKEALPDDIGGGVVNLYVPDSGFDDLSVPMYLYKSADAESAENKITKDEFEAIFNSGKRIQVVSTIGGFYSYLQPTSILLYPPELGLNFAGLQFLFALEGEYILCSGVTAEFTG